MSQPHFGGRRWWFVCPRLNRRVRKLYLPLGGRHFWSRHAYRLGYASQRGTDIDQGTSRTGENQSAAHRQASTRTIGICHRSRSGCDGGRTNDTSTNSMHMSVFSTTGSSPLWLVCWGEAKDAETATGGKAAMPLTLRPTGLSADPDRKDWTVHADGYRNEIGRIYENQAAADEDVRWFWAIQVVGAHRGRHRHHRQCPELSTWPRRRSGAIGRAMRLGRQSSRREGHSETQTRAATAAKGSIIPKMITAATNRPARSSTGPFFRSAPTSGKGSMLVNCGIGLLQATFGLWISGGGDGTGR